LCLCSPCGAALGGVVLVLFRDQTLGARRLRIEYAGAGLSVGVLASLALLFGIPILNSIRLSNHYIENQSIGCVSNVRKLSVAFMLYNQDYDGSYPPAQSWNEAMFMYVTHDVLFCPSADGMCQGL
jgi:hypothetical protein